MSRASPEDERAPVAEAPREPDLYGVSRAELEQLRLPRDATGEIAERRRRWPFVAVLALLSLCAGLALWLSSERAQRVETARAVPLTEVGGRPVPVLSGSGYLVPGQPFIAVGSRVAGRIARYLVEEGDWVHAGQPLVELDEAPFRAAVDQARASLRAARAQSRLADSELARTQRLVETGVVSKDELDRRQSDAKVARARIAELEAALDRTQTDLEDAVIRAPTDGVVLETFKQPGEVAVPGGFSGSGDLLRLANLAELRAELDVNEADLSRVVLGQSAEVVPDAFPSARYAARVVKLAPQIDRQKGTREVEVRVLEPDDKLLPDMSVRVVFLEPYPEPGAAGAGQTVVPRGALRQDAQGESFVWVVRDGRSARVPVTVETTLGDHVVLSKGPAAGEAVVVGEPPSREGAVVEASAAPDVQ